MTFQEFMPNWKKYEQCFEEEKVGAMDIHRRKKLDKDGKPEVMPWPHDKPIAEITYENFLKVVVDPSTNEYFPARNKDGNAIKGTGPKYILDTIIRIRRKDQKEYLYSQGIIEGYDAMGNRVRCTCRHPEVWTRTLFDHQRIYDQRSNSVKVKTVGTIGSEEVYEMPFNEANLKQLVDQMGSFADTNFCVKDEQVSNPVEVKKDVNINKTMELFLKPFDYLFKAEYISPQQRAELRQAAIDQGIIPPSNPVSTDGPPPPKGTYS